jgi:acetate kinase
MRDALLVLNAGSSSLKFSVLLDEDVPTRVLYGQIEGLQGSSRFGAHDASGLIAERTWPADDPLGHEGAIDFLLRWGRTGVLGGYHIVAVGHRVVHGGLDFSGSTLIDDAVLAALEALVPLAPLHQPHNLAAVRAVMEISPTLPQVACFDTAFHRTQPPVAQSFALPRRFSEDGVRRYGFHGLSCEYVVAALARIDPRAAAGRVIVAHLGSGASLTAVANGHSVATTMGFSPLDGLMMGTRCGAIDPGVLLHLLDRYRMSGRDLEHLLYQESGLLGVSDTSGDMRELLASDDVRAAEAVDLFVYRIGRELGSLAAALGGLDALVFTGGIGEHAAVIRERVCRNARWLGVRLDKLKNARGGPRINSRRSHVSTWVIPTSEETIIARHTRRILSVWMARGGERGPHSSESTGHTASR